MSLTPPPSQQERQKMLDARKSHAHRSIVLHYHDPSRPIYSIADLIRHGWDIDVMVESYRDFLLGRCPGGCGRYAIDIPPREISIDIDDPALPPFWGINTKWMCTRDNGHKARKSRQQRIEEALAILDTSATDASQAEPPPYPDDSLFGTWAQDEARRTDGLF